MLRQQEIHIHEKKSTNHFVECNGCCLVLSHQFPVQDSKERRSECAEQAENDNGLIGFENRVKEVMNTRFYFELCIGYQIDDAKYDESENYFIPDYSSFVKKGFDEGYKKCSG